MIDCPPSLGILTLNALAAVTEVLIPLQPHFFALHGLSKLLETVDLVAARLNDKLRLSGVILCMFDANTRLAAEVGQDVETFFANARGQSTPWADAEIFHTRIRRNIRLAEAPSFGQSIFQYAPTPTAPTITAAWPRRSREAGHHAARQRARRCNRIS